MSADSEADLVTVPVSAVTPLAPSEVHASVAAAPLVATPADSLLGDKATTEKAASGTASRPVRMVLNRQIRSGLMGGKRFEIAAKIDSSLDLSALFKGYPDELVLAYKSVFSDKSQSLKRSELLRGTRVVVGSFNEMIELEERLRGAFDQLRAMIEIVETGERDVVVGG